MSVDTICYSLSKKKERKGKKTLLYGKNVNSAKKKRKVNKKNSAKKRGIISYGVLIFLGK